MMDSERFWRPKVLERAADSSDSTAFATARALLALREQIAREGRQPLEDITEDRRASLLGTVNAVIWQSMPPDAWLDADRVYELASGPVPKLFWCMPFQQKGVAVDPRQRAAELSTWDNFLAQGVAEVDWEGENAVWVSVNACNATDEILCALMAVSRGRTPVETRVASCCRHTGVRWSGKEQVLAHLDEDTRFHLYASTVLSTVSKFEDAAVVERVGWRALEAAKVQGVLDVRDDLHGRLILTDARQHRSDELHEGSQVMAFTRR